MLVLQQIFRGANVGSEHALLDQLVRFIAHHRDDALDFAVLIELELELHRLEIERAAQLPGRRKRFVQRMQIGEMRQQGFGTPILDAGRLRKPFPYLRVCEPCARMHHAGIEAVSRDVALAADLHVANHAQAIDRWLQ